MITSNESIAFTEKEENLIKHVVEAYREEKLYRFANNYGARLVRSTLTSNACWDLSVIDYLYSKPDEGKYSIFQPFSLKQMGISTIEDGWYGSLTDEDVEIILPMIQALEE